ncbi:MAG: T9SS type A sorting domain-containing protein [Gemmatimonadetes bacterium]|nr:T9SS type A sorting domain-containing protein [Gemmatimonadota bacterium]
MTRDGLRVVFAGAAAVSGPGELLRIDRVGPDPARLTQAELNDGRLEVRLADSMSAIAGQPLTYVLHANVPNPFNPETSIRFDLAQESVVRLEVFDVVGQQVRTLVTEQRSAGTHRVVWDGRDERGVPVSSGIYVYRLQAGTFEQVRRMLLLK